MVAITTTFEVQFIQSNTPYYHIKDNNSPYFIRDVSEQYETVLYQGQEDEEIFLGPVRDDEGDPIQLTLIDNGNEFVTMYEKL